MTPATGTTAIATAVACSGNVALLGFTLHLSAAGTTSESLTVTKNSVTDAKYDTLLYTVNTLTGGTGGTAITDHYVGFDPPINFINGDTIDFAWPNTEGRTYGLQVVTKAA
jgi:hypothetical protein